MDSSQNPPSHDHPYAAPIPIAEQVPPSPKPQAELLIPGPSNAITTITLFLFVINTLAAFVAAPFQISPKEEFYGRMVSHRSQPGIEEFDIGLGFFLLLAFSTTLSGLSLMVWSYQVGRFFYHRPKYLITNTPGQLVFSFFLPISNWFTPYRIFSTICRECSTLTSNSTKYLNAWWVFAGMSFFVMLGTRGLAGNSRQAITYQEYALATVFALEGLKSLAIVMFAFTLSDRIREIEEQEVEDSIAKPVEYAQSTARQSDWTSRVAESLR